MTGTGGGPVYSGGPMRVELWVPRAEPMAADAVAVTLYDQTGFKLVNADTVCLGRASSNWRPAPGARCASTSPRCT